MTALPGDPRAVSTRLRAATAGLKGMIQDAKSGLTRAYGQGSDAVKRMVHDVTNDPRAKGAVAVAKTTMNSSPTAQAAKQWNQDTMATVKAGRDLFSKNPAAQKAAKEHLRMKAHEKYLATYPMPGEALRQYRKEREAGASRRNAALGAGDAALKVAPFRQAELHVEAAEKKLRANDVRGAAAEIANGLAHFALEVVAITGMIEGGLGAAKGVGRIRAGGGKGAVGMVGGKPPATKVEAPKHVVKEGKAGAKSEATPVAKEAAPKAKGKGDGGGSSSKGPPKRTPQELAQEFIKRSKGKLVDKDGALATTFGRTRDAGNPAKKRPPGRLHPWRAAAARELADIDHLVKRRDVVKVEVVPSRGGRTSNDINYTLKNGEVHRWETGTATSAPNIGKSKHLDGRALANRRVNDIPRTSAGRQSKLREAMQRKLAPRKGKPKQLASPQDGVKAGGTLSIHAPHLKVTRSDCDKVIADMSDKRSPKDPGRKLTADEHNVVIWRRERNPRTGALQNLGERYVRQPDGTYKHQETLRQQRGGTGRSTDAKVEGRRPVVNENKASAKHEAKEGAAGKAGAAAKPKVNKPKTDKPKVEAPKAAKANTDKLKVGKLKAAKHKVEASKAHKHVVHTIKPPIKKK